MKNKHAAARPEFSQPTRIGGAALVAGMAHAKHKKIPLRDALEQLICQAVAGPELPLSPACTPQTRKRKTHPKTATKSPQPSPASCQ